MSRKSKREKSLNYNDGIIKNTTVGKPKFPQITFDKSTFKP